MVERGVKSSDGPRRPYHSPKREQQALATRRRIRAAAQELFLTRGYNATSVNAIASAAGVAIRTLFLAFPGKAALLSEIIQVAVRGDDQDLPVAAREQWQAMLALPADQLLESFAAGTATILARTARLLELGDLAADQDRDLASFRDRGHANMRADFREIATELTHQKAIAPSLSIQHTADTIYALSNHDVYLRLTRECGWTPDHYTTWLATTLQSTLLNGPGRTLP
jgi:AcrR family transcriptional regulator